MITLTALLCLNAKKVLGQDSEFNKEQEKFNRKMNRKIRLAGWGYLISIIALFSLIFILIK